VPVDLTAFDLEFWLTSAWLVAAIVFTLIGIRRPTDDEKKKLGGWGR
jgi:hypothetical protein